MKLITKKLWVFVAMLCTLISASAYDFEVDGIYYTITSTAGFTCEVSGSNTDLDELVIPEEVTYLNRSLKVTALGNNAFSGSQIESVTLPQSVKSIKKGCFSNSKIKHIENTSSISFLGEECFKNCGSLDSFTFGQENTIRFGIRCFWGCTSLESIKIPSNAILDGHETFEGCTALREVEIDCKTLPSDCFSGCSSLKTIILGENCESLGPNCFYGCKSLENINIPTSIVGIGSYCFGACSSLRSIIIPESVKLRDLTNTDSSEEYGYYMFRNCTSLETVEWNANVIPNGAFEGCTSLKSLTIGENTSQIYLGSVPFSGNSSKPHFTFDRCDIHSLRILHNSLPLKLLFIQVRDRSSSIMNSLEWTGYQQELLQIFDKVEELYIAREIKSLKDMDDGCQYNNLKRLIIGIGNPKFVDPGGYINWKTLQYLKSELPSPPYLYDVFTTAQYTTMEVEVPIYTKLRTCGEIFGIYRDSMA